ncbi:rod shape-determining protein MreC [Muribaculaceae bacterium Isolate-104 (HZI)]|nr:rod shape-determining protein MreC [Muribaculaceae bacterium Isolate-104 (HZI)]
MRNLINFLFRYSAWILFITYTVASCVLLFRNSPYQHHVFLTSANSVVSGVYSASSSVTAYFNLKGINEDLQRRNTDLELEVLNLKRTIDFYREKEYADSVPVDSSLQRYSFITAHVINNTITKSHNYITLNKGTEDGLRPEMGVVDQNGVVGIVNVVGPHSARVISLLNPFLRLSCKVKGHNHVGSLVWQGNDYTYAILEELPRHAEFQNGDTIVTSGYSTVFPEGVPVGVVEEGMKEHDENFYALKVRLFTDFATLSTVRVIRDEMTDEINDLEKNTIQPTKKP